MRHGGSNRCAGHSTEDPVHSNVFDLTTGYAGGTTLDAMLGTLMIANANRSTSNLAHNTTAVLTMGGGAQSHCGC